MPEPDDAAPGQARVADLISHAWTEAVGFDHFGPDDDFFALGGDSFSAAVLARRIGKAIDIHVPPRALFEYPTFGCFTAFVEARRQPAPVVEPRIDPTTHPLTEGQERLWLLSRLHPDQARYTVAVIVELTGNLDAGALSEAVLQLVTRHEPLRTVIDDSGTRAVCRVRQPSPVQIHAKPATSDQDAREQAAGFLRLPFALADEPPMRIQRLRLGPARHWLVLAIDHIATDGDSVQILLDELGLLYNAALGGTPAALAPLSVTYGDIAAWRSGRSAGLTAGSRDRQLGRLRGHEDRPLALEGPGHDVAAGVGARHTRWLGGPLTESLRACASTHRTTMFVTLLAAFADIAARWSGADDVCVGYPVSRREPPPARDLAGFFIDTCVLRVSLSGRPSFASVIDRVRSGVVEAVADAVPFDVLAEEVAAARGYRVPLFRTWFNYLGEAIRPPEMTGLTAAMLDIPAPPALFDLNVYVTEHDADIRIDLVYDIAVCSDDAAGEVLDQYFTLLAEAVAAPQAPLRRHGRATRPSARLPDPGDPLDTAPPETLARRLAAVARSRGTSIALRDAGGDVSFTELRAAVRGLADAVRAAGIRPGHTVAVYGTRDAGTVTAMLAVLASRARLLMLDPAYPAARLARYLAAGRARCLIASGVPVPGLQTEALIRLERGTPVVERVAARDVPDPARGAAYLAFTSGSTGEPVGVVGGLEPIEHFLHWYSTEYELGSHDRFALLAGLAHDPLFRDVLLPLWNGATLCIPSPETFRVPAELACWLRDEQVSVVNLTPLLARLLTADGLHLPALRLICLAGDAVTAADVERLAKVAPGAVLLNGYGTTETPQLVSRRPLSAGQPPALGARAPGSQLLVVNADGELCGIGEEGSIVVRSRHLAAEVLPADVLAGEALAGPGALLGDPLPGVRRFPTGDLGRYRTDGSITYLGRTDDMVNIRGFLAHPAETDRALAADPRVTASLTVPWMSPDGPELASYVVAVGVGAAEIRARLAALLPAPLVPTVIVPVDRLPVTANGKIDRAALPAARPAEPPGRVLTGPASSLESRLARIWSVVLGVEHIDVTTSFFELGGTSLSMLRLHSAIRREVDERVSLLALYENPSVRAMAQSMSRSAATIAPAGQVRGSRTDERSRRLAARRHRPPRSRR
jgi:non-ribosomal peptide synthetase component F